MIVFSDQFYNKEPKMTREEAIKLVAGMPWNSAAGIVKTLEALGLLKFDDEPFYKYGITHDNLKALDQAGYKIVKENEIFNQHNKWGTIRVEEWPKGLVLWVNGEIKWKSWEPKLDK